MVSTTEVHLMLEQLSRPPGLLLVLHEVCSKPGTGSCVGQTAAEPNSEQRGEICQSNDIDRLSIRTEIGCGILPCSSSIQMAVLLRWHGTAAVNGEYAVPTTAVPRSRLVQMPHHIDFNVVRSDQAINITRPPSSSSPEQERQRSSCNCQ